MECLLQYLDDLDDAVYAIALLGERIRRVAITLAIVFVSAVMQVAVVVLALNQPSLGVGAASLLTVSLMYRSITAGPPRAPEPVPG